MANNRTVSTILKYQVDKSSVRAAEQSAKDVSDSLKDLSPVARSSVRSIQRDFDQLRDMVKDDIRVVDELRATLNDLDKVKVAPEIDIKRNEQVRQSVGDVSTFAGSLSSVVGGSGAPGQALGLAGDIAGAIEYIPLFKRGVKEIGNALLETGGITTRVVDVLGKAPVAIASLGLAAGAVVALGVAFEQFNKQIADSQKTLDAAIGAQDAYYEALRNSTTADVAADVERRTRDNEVLQQQISETQSQIDAAYQQAVETFGELGAKALDKAGQLPTAALREQLTTLQAEYDTNAIAVERLTTGIQQNAFAANDAIAAHQEMSEVLKQDAQLRIAQAERQRQNYLEDAQLLAGTAEAAKDRRDGLNNEIFALRNMITTLQEASDGTAETNATIEAYRQQLADLAEDERRLTLVTIPLIQAREAEAAAIEKVNSVVGSFIGGIRNVIGGVSDGIKRLNEADLKSREAFDKLAKARDENLIKLAERQSDESIKLAQRLNEDLRKLNEDWGEQSRRDGIRRNEELAKFQQEEVRRTEDYYRALADTRKKFDRDARRAVAALDANALQQAIEARDDELEQQESAFDIANERRQQDLDNLIRSLDNQDTERNRDYQRRYNELVRANQTERQTLDAKYRAEKQALDAKYQADVAAAQQNYLMSVGLLNSEVMYRRTTNSTILSDLGQFANEARERFASIFNRSSPGNVIIPRTEIISAEEAQRRIAEQNQQQLGAQSLVTAGAGGTTYNITIGGTRLSKDELLALLRQMANGN